MMKKLRKIKSNIQVLSLLAVFGGLLLTTSCGGDDEPTPTPDPLDDLVAGIDLSAITFKTDTRAVGGQRIKAAEAIAFKDGSTGDPDSWSWTFPGGTPETSTDQNPSVIWSDQVGQVKIILEVTRSEDGETETAEFDLQVGPVEIFDRAVFGLEDQDTGVDALSKWFFWTPNDGSVSLALETSEGANETTQSLKLTADSNFGEFQLRPHENGPEFLASLESNTEYAFSFYMRASEALTLSEVSVLNVKNDDPKEGWYTPLWTGDAAITDPDVTTEWEKFTYEFTTADHSTFGDAGYADGTADNAGPFFKHFAAFSGTELNVWIDEMSLKEMEQD